jgi:quaternary ammonium compound-resistance protein SugE
MAWITLFLAGLFEIAWAVGLKYTEHFTRPLPTALTVIAMIASVVLLEHAVRTLPLGTAYAIWTGIGAIGTVLFGIWLFGESTSLARVVCLALIVIGIVGLRVIPVS